MGSIWAVARHTFAQCLRMKIAVVFMLLLGLTVGAMPFTMKHGDGTLSGQVRTFLSYSASITWLLLSLVTILLSVAVVTSDVRDKQIFTVTTKPVARWQYLIGRWLGVVLLGTALLLVSGGVIYGVSQYLRGREAMGGPDRRAVETEVFTARRKVPPEPFDVEPDMVKRIARLHAEGRYQEAIDRYKVRTAGDENLARAKLEEEIRKQILQERQSCGHGESVTWKFSGIQTAGREIRGSGRVAAIDPSTFSMWIEGDSRVMGQLLYGAPVRIQEVEGAVIDLRDEYMQIRFDREDMNRMEIASLEKGSNVEIVVDPAIQIRYKLEPAVGAVPDSKLDSYWVVMNNQTGFYRPYPRENPVRIAATITVPARAAQPNGQIQVTYVNLGNVKSGFQSSVMIPRESLGVLYRAGSFEMNFLRGGILILLQVIFLAGVGTFAGSFLSFPVATLLCLMVLVFGIGRGFLSEALKIVDLPGLKSGPVTIIGHYALKTMSLLLPNFQDSSPAGALADGMYIPWGFLGWSVLPWIVLRTGFVLGIACLIFHKRELARVQV